MDISHDEATARLQSIEAVQDRSVTVYGYKSAAPFLMLWGAIWVLGYSATDLWRAHAAGFWGVLIAVGCAGTAMLIRHAGVHTGDPARAWRIGLTCLACAAFIVGLFVIMAPVNSRQIGSFFPLFFGTVYAVMGVWIGARFAVVGLTIAALALAGFFFVESFLGLWLAVVGGGTLLLSGLWLRTA
jgi:hypothetical protein